MRMKMKLEDAMVYALVIEGHGMTTDRLAEYINRNRLHIRKDGLPVTSKQVYAIVCRFPEIFVKEEGRIRVIM